MGYITSALWCIIISSLCHCDVNPRQTSFQDARYCDTHTFNASCDPGEVILLTKALYGRMSMGKCISKTYGHLGCSADVIEFVDMLCSGRRTCDMRVSDDRVVSQGQCPEDLRSYLEAGYQCVRVQTSNTSCRSGQPVRTSSSRGVLANVVTEATGCGELTSPWIIQALPGQTISVTLYDFHVFSRKKAQYSRCQLYAEIRERQASVNKSVTVCGGKVREKHCYRSTTNTIEIGLVDNQEDGIIPYFFLRYEAIGCEDIPAPPYSQLTRHGNIITVKCNHSNDGYELRCIGNQWIGESVNCSHSLLHTIEPGDGDSGGIPYGMSILIVLAIALTIGLFVLLAGLIFLRRHWGLCTGQSMPQSRCIARQDVDDKEYASSMWIRSRESPDSRKHWRDGDSYSTYTTSELPPCTPLMERGGTRPPVYGQVQQKLPCGCPAYVENPDLSTYVSRQQLLQNSGGRQERLILKPGEPTQYFIVDSERSLQGKNSPSKGSSDCVGCDSEQASCSKETKQPDVKQSRPNVVMQTDDIKLRLRISDVPCTGSVQVSERHPLVEVESNSSTSQDRQIQSEEYSQAAPLPDVSYPAVCKERMENEANDGHNHVKGHSATHQAKTHPVTVQLKRLPSNKCPHKH